MNKTNKATARVHAHIQKRVENMSATLDKLRDAAETLVAYGWFEDNDVERFSRYEHLDIVRDAIGEAAELWGVPATERVVRALEVRNAWPVSGYGHNVPELLERWKERESLGY